MSQNMGEHRTIDRPKPKLLLVGHTYMIAVNREKANALGEFFEVCVCTSDSSGWIILGEEVRDTDADGRPRHYQLHRLPRWPKTRKYTAFLLRGLASAIREFRPDIVLLENEPWSLLRWQARLCAWQAAPTADFVEFSWENIRRTGFKGLLSDIIYRAAAKTAGKVICGNQGAARLFLDAGLSAEKLHIDAQLGVGESDFPIATCYEKRNWRIQMGWMPDDFVVGFCGRLVEEKGVLELAMAVDSLRAESPELRLAILGRGPMEAALAEIDGAGEWLRCLPPVLHVEVHAFLNKLDLFVLPSKPLNQGGRLWEEQFGHVLIEAITAGTLAIGSDSGAIPEVLADPQWIFPHGSQHAISEIVRRILGDLDRLPALRGSQRENCLSRWNHAALASRYAEFLESPISLNRRSR